MAGLVQKELTMEAGTSYVAIFFQMEFAVMITWQRCSYQNISKI